MFYPRPAELSVTPSLTLVNRFHLPVSPTTTAQFADIAEVIYIGAMFPTKDLNVEVYHLTTMVMN